MDRVSSTMKQVSNPLPKVLSRRAGGGGLEAERESFERAQVRAGQGGAGDANGEEGKVPAEGAGPGWGAVLWERPDRYVEWCRAARLCRASGVIQMGRELCEWAG